MILESIVNKSPMAEYLELCISGAIHSYRAQTDSDLQI